VLRDHNGAAGDYRVCSMVVTPLDRTSGKIVSERTTGRMIYADAGDFFADSKARLTPLSKGAGSRAFPFVNQSIRRTTRRVDNRPIAMMPRRQVREIAYFRFDLVVFRRADVVFMQHAGKYACKPCVQAAYFLPAKACGLM
jgi:hypothetical protein